MGIPFYIKQFVINFLSTKMLQGVWIVLSTFLVYNVIDFFCVWKKFRDW